MWRRLRRLLAGGKRDDHGRAPGTEQLREDQFGELILRENLMSLGRLASGVAHEFGNPLTTISSVAQLLRRRRGDDEFVREQTEIIERHVKRLSRLSRQLVDLAFPRTPKVSEFDLHALVEDTLSVTRLDRRLKKVRIDRDLRPEGIRVRADAGAVHLILLNLLFNAGDAMGGEGRITLRTARTGDAVELRVEDTGPGIPAEIRSRVFGPFFTTKPPGAGTGLGLSISCRLARSSGGELGLESTGPDGTSFLLTLRPAEEAG